MHSLEADCSTSVQQQSTSSTGMQRSKLHWHSELGHSELGAQSGRKNQLADVSVCSSRHAHTTAWTRMLLGGMVGGAT